MTVSPGSAPMTLTWPDQPGGSQTKSPKSEARERDSSPFIRIRTSWSSPVVAHETSCGTSEGSTSASIRSPSVASEWSTR